MLRCLVVEKHVARRYIEAGLVDLPNFEAPGYVRSSNIESTPSTGLETPVETSSKGSDVEDEPAKLNAWAALLTMITSMRPVTLFLLTLLNGITLGGLLGASSLLPSCRVH